MFAPYYQPIDSGFYNFILHTTVSVNRISYEKQAEKTKFQDHISRLGFSQRRLKKTDVKAGML